MSKCTITFNIHASDGTTSPIELVVPDVSEISLEDAIKYLMENEKEKFSELMSSVNRSGFPQSDIKISEIQKTMPAGNYTLN